MLKQALSEFRSKSTSFSSKYVNGKGSAAAREETVRGRNGKGVRVAVSDTTETDPIIEIEKIASHDRLTMFCHVDATDWCPNGDTINKLSQFFTKKVNVEIYPRHMVETVWSKDHCDKPYEKDYYAFRAYAGKDYCKIFVDETETKDSVLWVMLHELAHIALASAPYLFRGYRHLTPANYFESDEAHESDPEEKMANEIAVSWMDMLGYGKVCYPRHWWRQRTLMNRKEEPLLKVANYDKLRGYTKALRDI